MGERTYITLQVPEEHYLPVLRFLGSGCTPTRVEDLSDELIAAVLAQSKPADVRDWRDDEIDRLGEALHSAEAQNNEQAAFIGTLQGRIRELEAERNEWRTKAEREQSTEAAAAPEATVPAPSLPEATPVEEAAPEPEPPAAEPQAVPLPRPEAAPAAEATRVHDLVGLRQLSMEKNWPAAALAEALGVSAWKVGQAWLGKAPELVDKLAAFVATAEPRPSVATSKKQPYKPPSAEGLTEAERMDWAGRFVKACFVKQKDGEVLSSTLPELYEKWAKLNNAPALSHRVLGAAMRQAHGKAKLKYFRDRPGKNGKAGLTAQTYEGVAERKWDDVLTADLREAMKPKGPAREIVVEDDRVAPYVEPKPKPKPGKQPILAVRNADQRPTLRDYSSVRVIKADGAVTYVDAMDWIDPDEDHEPIKPEDADRTTFDLWTDVKNGMRDRPLGYLPDVLALEGVNTDELEATVKDPAHVEIRPETRSKGYPVLGFRRGDVKVIVGFRDQQKPAVIAAYWDALLTPDSHVVYRHGGGGSKKQTGLPTTVKQSVTQLKRRGFEIDAAWEKATQPVEVSYDGQVLGKMKVHLANKQQVQGDFQRLLRQAHAIDRRKGLVSA